MGVPLALLSEPGVPLGNVHVHVEIAYAYVPDEELTPLAPNAEPRKTESGAVITALSVRFVVHVVPDAIYEPNPGRAHGTHALEVLNVPAGDSPSEQGVTTLIDFDAVPLLSSPPLETVRLIAYVPGAVHVGWLEGEPVALLSEAGVPLGNDHAQFVIA